MSAYYFNEYQQLKRKITSLEYDVNRLRVIDEKCGLCIKHPYLSGMTIKEISQIIRWDRKSVRMMLVQMRVKLRQE